MTDKPEGKNPIPIDGERLIEENRLLLNQFLELLGKIESDSEAMIKNPASADAQPSGLDDLCAWIGQIKKRSSEQKIYAELMAACHKRKPIQGKNWPRKIRGKEYALEHKDALLKLGKEHGCDRIVNQLEAAGLNDAELANAFTEMARALFTDNPKMVAQLAYQAWLADPKPYRLKYYGFRTHDAGDVSMANGIMSALPQDVSLNPSEQKRRDNITREASIFFRRESRKELAEKYGNLINALENPPTDILANRVDELKEGIRQAGALIEALASQRLSYADQASSLENIQKGYEEALETLGASKDNELLEQKKGYEEVVAGLNADKRDLEKELADSRMNESRLETLYMEADERNRQVLREKQDLELANLDGMDSIAKLKLQIRQLEDSTGEKSATISSLLAAQEENGRNLNDNLRLITQQQTQINDSVELVQSLQSRIAELSAQNQNLAEQNLKLESRLREFQYMRDGQEQRQYLLEEIKAITGEWEKESLAQGAALQNSINEILKRQDNTAASLLASIKNNVAQTDALYQISRLLEKGDIEITHPWQGEAAASPDFVLWIMELLNKGDYGACIEFGCGYTTLYAAELIKRGMIGQPGMVFLSFEHSPHKYEIMSRLLAEKEVGGRIEAIHAPLKSYENPDESPYQFYDCLPQISARLSFDLANPLLVIMGNAIKPAAKEHVFPLLMGYFKRARIDIPVSDYAADKDMIQNWRQICAAAGIENSLRSPAFNSPYRLLSIR